MKNPIKLLKLLEHLRIPRAALLLLVLLLLALLPLPAARADAYSTTAVQFTNSASGPLYTNTWFTLTNGQTRVINSDPIPLANHRGIGVFLSAVATNATTAGWTNTFDLANITGSGSTLATNWTTTHPLSVATTLNGTTVVSVGANLPATSLDNFALIRWAQSINGHTNTITVTNCWANWSLAAP